MYTHINNLLKYNADGAIGRVKSYFHVNAPKWITDCPVYHRDANPSGEIPALLNTGNCMIKSEFFIKKDTSLTQNMEFQEAVTTISFQNL